MGNLNTIKRETITIELPKVVTITKEESKRYVESGGTECPKCGSTSICPGDTCHEDAVMYEMQNCQDCDAAWYSKMTLAGCLSLDHPELS